jgi:hypothetical protein
MRDFLEQDALVQLPALTEAQAPAALAQTFRDLLNDNERRRRIGERARTALEQSRGATDKTIALLAPLIEHRSEIRS